MSLGAQKREYAFVAQFVDLCGADVRSTDPVVGSILPRPIFFSDFRVTVFSDVQHRRSVNRHCTTPLVLTL